MFYCNTFKDKRHLLILVAFQVIIDLVHDFINFNALKIILKIHKKTLACESSPKCR